MGNSGNTNKNQRTEGASPVRKSSRHPVTEVDPLGSDQMTWTLRCVHKLEFEQRQSRQAHDLNILRRSKEPNFNNNGGRGGTVNVQN